MEDGMHDLALQISGALAILAGVVHGVLGETRVFARARVEPAGARRLLRLVWQCSAVAWVGGGILLLAAPYLSAETARRSIVLVLAAVYGFAALANAWATRGRHFGWMVLSGVVALALVGL
jgi:hypothetical protein